MAEKEGELKKLFSDKGGKKKMWLYIAIGVAGLILTYFIYKKMTSGSGSATTTVTPLPAGATGASTGTLSPGLSSASQFNSLQDQLNGISSMLSASTLTTGGTGANPPASALSSSSGSTTAASTSLLAPPPSASLLAPPPSASNPAAQFTAPTSSSQGATPASNGYYSSGYGQQVTASSILASNPAMGANASAAASNWNAGNLAQYNNYIANGGSPGGYTAWSGGNPVPA